MAASHQVLLLPHEGAPHVACLSLLSHALSEFRSARLPLTRSASIFAAPYAVSFLPCLQVFQSVCAAVGNVRITMPHDQVVFPVSSSSSCFLVFCFCFCFLLTWRFIDLSMHPRWAFCPTYNVSHLCRAVVLSLVLLLHCREFCQ